jgi:hypothetical protein
MYTKYRILTAATVPYEKQGPFTLSRPSSPFCMLFRMNGIKRLSRGRREGLLRDAPGVGVALCFAYENSR